MTGPPADAVAVSGLGFASPLGHADDAVWARLVEGAPAFRELTRFDAGGQRTRLAAEVDPWAEAGTGERATPLPRGTSWNERLGVAAAQRAVRDAGLPPPAGSGRVGVFFGTSTGGLCEAEAFFAAFRSGEPADLHAVLGQQNNVTGDEVARRLGAGGPVETVSSACAAAALAIGDGLDALRAGEVDVAIAGGADSLCRLTYSGFNALRAVDDGPCRPFRADRAGLSLGEGGSVLVLERLADALVRGVRPRALLLGAGASCDSHHMTAPDPEGGGAALAIERALNLAGRTADVVDFVNAHGTGTRHNDASEAAALHRVLGGRAGTVPVTSTKALVGHLLGSSGAFEAGVTVLCLEHETVHPMPGGGPADADLGLDLVLDGPRAVPGCRAALSTSFAFGGANAALLLGRWTGEMP